MLIIRSEQIEALRDATMSGFENEMLNHLSDFSPPLFKAAGEEQMRKAIRLGIDRARSYGFTFRGPVRLYLELMLLFGSQFDTDPQYPWANEILNNHTRELQMPRADLLYEKTLAYRQSVNGPKDAFLIAAARKMATLAEKPLPPDSSDISPFMLQEIQRIYPQKAQYVGHEGLEQLVAAGIEEAHRYDFSANRAIVNLIMMMLIMGHGCTEDPLYPWIGRTLKNKALADPGARARRLEKRGLTWLEHVLAYLEKGEIS